MGSADQKALPSIEWLFTRAAFYAEFGPLPEHSGVIENYYVLNDQGIMTADRRDFASPFNEVAFVFPKGPANCNNSPKVVVAEPRFGHRKRNRAFHGWIFGIKSKPSCRMPSMTGTPLFTDCQARLERAIRDRASCVNILKALDCFAVDFAQLSNGHLEQNNRLPDDPHIQVKQLADRQGLSVRTLQRRIRTATGLPPKRLLNVERFGRAVYEVPLRSADLPGIAGDLGFSDQPHLTREFQRHAGLTPGSFQRTWHGGRGQTVRFVQDNNSPTRLKIAVWAPEHDN